MPRSPPRSKKTRMVRRLANITDGEIKDLYTGSSLYSRLMTSHMEIP